MILVSSGLAAERVPSHVALAQSGEDQTAGVSMVVENGIESVVVQSLAGRRSIDSVASAIAKPEHRRAKPLL